MPVNASSSISTTRSASPPASGGASACSDSIARCARSRSRRAPSSTLLRGPRSRPATATAALRAAQLAGLAPEQIADFHEQLLFGGRSGGSSWRSRLLAPKPVDAADDEEDRERDDDEIEHRVDEDAVLDDRRTGGFGFGDARIRLRHS